VTLEYKGHKLDVSSEIRAVISALILKRNTRRVCDWPRGELRTALGFSVGVSSATRSCAVIEMGGLRIRVLDSVQDQFYIDTKGGEFLCLLRADPITGEVNEVGFATDEFLKDLTA